MDVIGDNWSGSLCVSPSLAGYPEEWGKSGLRGKVETSVPRVLSSAVAHTGISATFYLLQHKASPDSM